LDGKVAAKLRGAQEFFPADFLQKKTPGSLPAFATNDSV
jgi:hypothetical protein